MKLTLISSTTRNIDALHYRMTAKKIPNALWRSCDHTDTHIHTHKQAKSQKNKRTYKHKHKVKQEQTWKQTQIMGKLFRRIHTKKTKIKIIMNTITRTRIKININSKNRKNGTEILTFKVTLILCWYSFRRVLFG